MDIANWIIENPDKIAYALVTVGGAVVGLIALAYRKALEVVAQGIEDKDGYFRAASGNPGRDVMKHIEKTGYKAAGTLTRLAIEAAVEKVDPKKNHGPGKGARLIPLLKQHLKNRAK